MRYLISFLAGQLVSIQTRARVKEWLHHHAVNHGILVHTIPSQRLKVSERRQRTMLLHSIIIAVHQLLLLLLLLLQLFVNYNIFTAVAFIVLIRRLDRSAQTSTDSIALQLCLSLSLFLLQLLIKLPKFVFCHFLRILEEIIDGRILLFFGHLSVWRLDCCLLVLSL